MSRSQNVTGQASVSTTFPEVWSTTLQVPLYKSLVALKVASLDIQKQLKVGDTFHKQYFGDLASETYVPGTPVSAKVTIFTDETLTCTTKKDVSIYVDDLDELQTGLANGVEGMLDQPGSLLNEMAYRLKDDIDQAVFAVGNLNRGIQFRGEHVAGGASGHSITATTANIVSIFSRARQKLRENNVSEGDWIAVINADTMELIEGKATVAGYKVADSTLTNGYMGEFMGFNLYLSENLPTSTTVSAGGVETGTYCRHHYFGKRGAIDAVIQQKPTMLVKDVSDKAGVNFICLNLYGTKVFKKNASRFLDARLHKV